MIPYFLIKCLYVLAALSLLMWPVTALLILTSIGSISSFSLKDLWFPVLVLPYPLYIGLGTWMLYRAHHQYHYKLELFWAIFTFLFCLPGLLLLLWVLFVVIYNLFT